MLAGLPAGPILIAVIGCGCLLCYLPVIVWTLARSGHIVLTHARTTPPPASQRQRLQNAVAEVSLAAGIAVPDIVVVRDLGPNALTAGTRSHPTIAVSPALLDLLDRRQLQAVVAHEVAHIVNRDIRWATLLGAIYVRYELLRQWAKISSRADIPTSVHGSIDLATVLVYAFRPGLRLGRWFARLTGLAAARRREYLADRTAAWLTRDPQALLDALTILSAANEAQADRGDELAHLCVVDPFPRASSDPRLMAAHPPLAERLERLRRLEGEMRVGDGHSDRPVSGVLPDVETAEG